MLERPVTARGGGATRYRQRGVYALEWALVFIAFFMLLYAIVSFGLGFLVRESMQSAVEDSARAALQFQPSSEDRISREGRKDRALAVVKHNLDWLPKELQATIDGNFSFMVCKLNDNASCTADMAPDAMACDINKSPCMVQVRLALPYAQHAFTPSLTLGLMELAMPDLQAQAQIHVDQKGF